MIENLESLIARQNLWSEAKVSVRGRNRYFEKYLKPLVDKKFESIEASFPNRKKTIKKFKRFKNSFYEILHKNIEFTSVEYLTFGWQVTNTLIGLTKYFDYYPFGYQKVENTFEEILLASFKDSSGSFIDLYPDKNSLFLKAKQSGKRGQKHRSEYFRKYLLPMCQEEVACYGEHIPELAPYLDEVLSYIYLFFVEAIQMYGEDEGCTDFDRSFEYSLQGLSWNLPRFGRILSITVLENPRNEPLAKLQDILSTYLIPWEIVYDNEHREDWQFPEGSLEYFQWEYKEELNDLKNIKNSAIDENQWELRTKFNKKVVEKQSIFEENFVSYETLIEKVGTGDRGIDGLTDSSWDTIDTALTMKWEVKDRIVKACVNLSSRQQNVVEMRAIDGKSFPEIGSELGITKERASHLYQQGRLKLLSSLRDLRDVI